MTAILETLSISMVVPLVNFLLDSQEYLNKITSSKNIYLQNFGHFLKDLNFDELIILFLSFLLSIFIVKSLVLSATMWLGANFTAKVEKDTSIELFKFYLKQNYSTHIYRDSSVILQNLVGEVGRFASSVCLPLINLMTEGLIVISIATVLLVVEPYATSLIAFFLTVITSLYYFFIKKKMKIWGEERLSFNQQRLQDINQSVGGIREILVMWRQKYFFKKFASSAEGVTEVGRKQYFFINIPKVLFELSAVLALVLLIYFLFIVRNTSVEIIPIIAFFSAASFKLIPAANRILTSLQFLRFSLAGVNRIYSDILESDKKNKKILNESIKEKIIDFNKYFEFKKLYFSYNKQGVKKEVLSNLNLKVCEGDIIGFVGKTGSGKTTLVDLFLGLLAPDKGKIIIDDLEFNSLNEKSWQKMIGYVPQDVYLINDSFKKNIAFGLDDNEIDDSKLKRAINLSKLDELINNSADGGVNSIIGERGVNLSGGQRQRIGIARALYNNPKILIFDEATSSLDASTESAILNEILKIKENKTIIMISHKHETLAGCNKIYELFNKNLKLIKGS